MQSKPSILIVDEAQAVVKSLADVEREIMQEQIRQNAAAIKRAEARVMDGIPRSTRKHHANKNRLALLKRRQAELIAEFMKL